MESLLAGFTGMQGLAALISQETCLDVFICFNASP